MNRWGTRVRRGVPIVLLVGGFAGPGRAREQAACRPRRRCRRSARRSAGSSTCTASNATTATTRRRGWTSTPSARRTWAGTRRPGRRSSGGSPPARCRRRARSGRRGGPTTRSSPGSPGSLDRAAAEQPDPGRTDTFRRLNRTEYQNAIRDLLALDVDASALLPADESSHGFDNVTVGDLSPTLLDRYITAAQKISRLAVGQPGPVARRRHDPRPGGPHPGGARRGAADRHPGRGPDPVHLPAGRRVRDPAPPGPGPQRARRGPARAARAGGPARPRAGGVAHRRRRPRSERDHQTADEHLKARVRVTAGPHEVGVTFLKKPSSLLETKRQPYQAHYNMHRHPRISPALFQVSITGPYDAEGHGDTPSRRRIFVCEPKGPGDEEACARRILSTLDPPGLSAAGHRRGPPEADGVLPRGPGGGGLRRGDRDGPERGAGEPAVPVPDRAGPARRRAGLGLPHPRPPARVPPVVLPLEQHPGRRAARPGRRAASWASPRCSNGRPAGCWPTPGRGAW